MSSWLEYATFKTIAGTCGWLKKSINNIFVSSNLYFLPIVKYILRAKAVSNIVIISCFQKSPSDIISLPFKDFVNILFLSFQLMNYNYYKYCIQFNSKSLITHVFYKYAYFGNIRTLFPVTSGQHSGIIRTV